jgi:sugar lactone lactonase YvrE/tetratricopeptide (TPR) repeat protein
MRPFFRQEFETRLLPRSLAATRRGFAFYVADPLSSIHEFTLNDPTTDSSLRQFVTLRLPRRRRVQLMSLTKPMRLLIVPALMCLAALHVSINDAAGVDLNNPTALAFDHSGNLFVADHAAETIFKFTPDGTKSVFVSGVRLSDGNGLACDAGDNLFVLSPSGEYHVSGTILKFSPDGSRSTFATGVGLPYSLAIDPSGNLFVSDWDTGSIYKLSPKGEKSTFATTEIAAKILACDQAGNLLAGVPLKHSIFRYEPGGARSDFAVGVTTHALAVDKAGNVYVGDTGNTIFKFTPTGAKSDFAEVTTSPRSFAFDASGNLFVVENFSGAISKFAPDGAQSVFLAGRPTPEPEEEQEAESETDSSIGLPDKYAKNYLIARSTISPNKKFAVIYPTDDYYQSADNAKDYLVTLQPFSILGALQAEEPYFQRQSHGGISAEWSDDSSVALITLDGKWGPRDVFLVEFHSGKPSRMTNVLRKAHELLPPNNRKAIFIEDEDTTFQLDGTSRVVIDAKVNTSPNDLGLSADTWRGHVEATWDVKQAKFTSKEITGRKRGADAYRNRGQSAAEQKHSSPAENVQNAIGLTSKGWDYYLSLAWYYLFDRNPREAIAASLKALELSPRNAAMIKVTLAHSYLFDNQFDKAKGIYLENKNAKLRDDARTFSQAVLDDFKELQDAGITHPDMEKIKALLTTEAETR